MPPLQNFLYNVQKGRKDVPSGPRLFFYSRPFPVSR